MYLAERKELDMGLIAKAAEPHGSNNPKQSRGLISAAGAPLCVAGAPEEDNNKKPQSPSGGLLSAAEPNATSGLISAVKGLDPE